MSEPKQPALTVSMANRLLPNCLSLDTIKYLVEVCGATNLNEAAAKSDNFEIIEYLCNKGANNYDEIYSEYKHEIRTEIFLINKGAKYEDVFPERFYPLFIKGGAGRILNHYPEFLTHDVAKPYLERKLYIKTILCNNCKLISDISGIVLSYLPYEKEKLTTEEYVMLLVEEECLRTKID